MKQISLLAALLVALLLTGCNCKSPECAPSALDVIMTRTSIRNFTGDPVSKEQLETILKAGMAAPTAMNVQPWRFVVVTDKDKIAEVFAAGPRSGMFTTAGAVIVVCGQTTFMRKPFGQPDGPETEQPNIFWYEDCSAATENILLAAHGRRARHSGRRAAALHHSGGRTGRRSGSQRQVETGKHPLGTVVGF